MSPEETARAIIETHVAAGKTLADGEELIAAIAHALKEADGSGFYRLPPAAPAGEAQSVPLARQGG